MLGTSHSGDYGEYRVEITFPKDEQLDPSQETEEIDLSIFPELDELPMMKGGGYGEVTVSQPPSDWYAIVRALRVRVFFDHDGLAGEYDSEAAVEALRKAEGVAQKVTATLVDWIRTEFLQTWLGLGGAEIDTGTTATLEDLDVGHRLPVNIGWGRVAFQAVDRRQAVPSERLQALLGRSSLSLPPLPESLAADAFFYANAAEPRDAERAVLVMAIACELKVKEVLRRSAHNEARPLLEWLLANPRDHSVAALALFDKAMNAVTGRSLRTEDSTLFKGVNRLFDLRNGLAHRGEIPTEDQVGDALRDGLRALRWLGEVDEGSSA